MNLGGEAVTLDNQNSRRHWTQNEKEEKKRQNVTSDDEDRRRQRRRRRRRRDEENSALTSEVPIIVVEEIAPSSSSSSSTIASEFSLDRNSGERNRNKDVYQHYQQSRPDASVLILGECEECQQRMKLSERKEAALMMTNGRDRRLLSAESGSNWTLAGPDGVPRHPHPHNNGPSVLPQYLENILHHHQHNSLSSIKGGSKAMKNNNLQSPPSPLPSQSSFKSDVILLPEDPSDPGAFTVTPGLTRLPKPPWCSSKPVLKIVGTFALLMSLGIIVAVIYMNWFSDTFRPMHM